LCARGIHAQHEMIAPNPRKRPEMSDAKMTGRPRRSDRADVARNFDLVYGPRVIWRTEYGNRGISAAKPLQKPEWLPQPQLAYWEGVRHAVQAPSGVCISPVDQRGVGRS